MTIQNQGILYENKIKNVLNECNVRFIDDDCGAFNSHEVDLKIAMKNGDVCNIEVKKDAKAQMGGTSVKYKNGNFELVDEFDGFESLTFDVLYDIREYLDNLIDFVKSFEPVEYHKNVCEVPFSATKKCCEELRKRGYLKPINRIVKFDLNFLFDHYAKKDCYYIQIGNHGLYYLKENVYNLPVPQLKCDFVIEIRLGRSGSKHLKSLDEKVAGFGLRVQGRLKGKLEKSPYSIDNIEDVLKLFGG